MMDTFVNRNKTPALLNQLIEKQTGNNLRDSEFACEIGIGLPLWKKTKLKKRNIGLTLLKAIARTYPDMHPDIIDFLKDSTGEIREGNDV